MRNLGISLSIFLSGRLVQRCHSSADCVIFVYFRAYIVLPTASADLRLTTVSILMAGYSNINPYRLAMFGFGFGNYHHRIHRIFDRYPGRPDVPIDIMRPLSKP